MCVGCELVRAGGLGFVLGSGGFLVLWLLPVIKTLYRKIWRTEKGGGR